MQEKAGIKRKGYGNHLDWHNVESTDNTDIRLSKCDWQIFSRSRNLLDGDINAEHLAGSVLSILCDLDL